MSPRMGAAPHSTAATTTGSGKAAGCMAAGGAGAEQEPSPRPRHLSFRIPGAQLPPGLTSQLHGGAGRGPHSGSESAKAFSGAGGETVNERWGEARIQSQVTEKLLEGWGDSRRRDFRLEGRLPTPSKRASGR